MTARDVRDVVLARLPAIGSPGERPFADPEIDRERALELIAREYVEALQQFDRTTLERAFARVRDTNTTGFWPSLGRLRQAALALVPNLPDPDAGRRREADKRAETYVSRFVRTSRVYREAKRDGWAGPLLDYVQSVSAFHYPSFPSSDDAFASVEPAITPLAKPLQAAFVLLVGVFTLLPYVRIGGSFSGKPRG